MLTNPLRPLSEGAAAFFLMASRGQPLSCENAALLEFMVPVICLFCDLRPVLGGKKQNKHGVQVCSRLSDYCRSQNHNYFSL